MPRQPHEVLGVPQHATREQVRAAYRRLTLLRHPDKPGGSHDSMVELNLAYEAMSKGTGEPSFVPPGTRYDYVHVTGEWRSPPPPPRNASGDPFAASAGSSWRHDFYKTWKETAEAEGEHAKADRIKKAKLKQVHHLAAVLLRDYTLHMEDLRRHWEEFHPLMRVEYSEDYQRLVKEFKDAGEFLKTLVTEIESS